MDFYLFRPYQKRRVTHTTNQALRKCCGCIHLRVGSAIACVIWVGLSLYFAIISFQDSSPFFSRLAHAPLIVFGVANLLFAIVALLALGALYRDLLGYIRTAQHAIVICIFIVLVDGFINTILFITQRGDYINWCISGGSRDFQPVIGDTSSPISVERDFYNCSRTWEDELKFGLLSIFMMIGFYVYWAMCFRSYRIKKAIILSSMVGAPVDHVALPSRTGAGGPQPPLGPPHPSRMPHGGVGGGMPMQRMGPNGRPNIIVLNNSKPSCKETSSKTPSPPPYGS
ncbi:hypothetical protein BDB00DRAFT_843740 [Zychaea mexicana]|uniref:uncharacterized protein n=1 Tax=Zychaea mexicana TaxID=64656 RepID=UPI0022FF3159|nr:uncharacterized protein BDB00DRAFT_843740 [Zychaea mexicana]KAI9489291.1 hypothetical protein BDB00DRAFT_843740 [Zychaea mexicana]